MIRRALLVVVLLLVVASPAGADEVRQGYTHSAGVPTFVGEADRTYVAASAGVETERAFVAAPSPFTLTEADVVGTPALGVCPLTSPLTGDGEISSDASPEADCSTVTPIVRADDGRWSVGLAPWPANGVAIVPLLAAGTTFRVAFDTTKTVVAPVAASTAPTTSASPVTATTAAPTPEPVFAVDPPPVVVVATPVAPATHAVAETPVGAPARTVLRSVVGAATPSSMVVLPAVALIAALALVLRNRGAYATAATPAAKPASGARRP